MKLLQANLDGVKEEMRKDLDWIVLNVSYEGMGKSSLGIVTCKYMDDDFDESRIVFSPMEFMEVVHKAAKYQAILVDEGAEVLFTRKAMHQENVDVVKMLSQIRYKNLFIVINIPDLFLIDSYIRGHRIRTLLRVISRGNLAFYSKRRIAQIQRDPEMKTTVWPQPNFFDRFPDCKKVYPELWKAYLEKKERYEEGGSSKIWDLRLKEQRKLQKKKYFTLKEWCIIKGLKRQFLKNLIYVHRVFPKSAIKKNLFAEVIISSSDMEKALKKFQRLVNNRKTSSNR